MTKYGYVVHTFRVHPWGKKEPLSLGDFDAGRDALPLLYGALRGLTQQGITVGTRHLRVKTLNAIGRTVQFSVEVGHSGQTSQFFDPDDNSKPVFERSDRHIETGIRRGLVVAPGKSSAGLLIMEVHGRSGAKTLLAPTLSKIFRHHTDFVLEIAAVADQSALEQFIAQAHAHSITLRKSGLPTDIADMVEINHKDASAGKIEMRITPGNKLKQFQQGLVDRLRGEGDTRQRLLHVHGLEFDELSVGMTVGERQTTLTVTADRVPSFVYDLSCGATAPSDDLFFDEVMDTVREIGPAVGVIVTPGWDTGDWSADAAAMILEVPEEGSDDGPTTDEPE